MERFSPSGQYHFPLIMEVQELCRRNRVTQRAQEEELSAMEQGSRITIFLQKHALKLLLNNINDQLDWQSLKQFYNLHLVLKLK